MAFNKGDILVCSTNKTSTTGYNLIVGEKYEIITDPEDWNHNSNEFSKIAFDVKNIKTGKIHRWIPARIFISLEVYREFKLREILDNESKN